MEELKVSTKVSNCRSGESAEISYGLYVSVAEDVYKWVKEQKWDHEVYIKIGNTEKTLTFDEFEKLIGYTVKQKEVSE
jgi:predicted RNase H-related nuclease YkuK (DUF458 family)